MTLRGTKIIVFRTDCRKSLHGCYRMKMEELIAAIILEEGEDDDLLV
jgi:hypothetical protein